MDYTAPVEVTPTRRRRVLPLLLAVLLVLAALGWLEFIQTTSGPLASPEGNSSSVTMRVEVGGQVSIGIFAPTNEGDGVLVIDSIVPDQIPEGLSVLGFGLIPWGQGGVGSDRGFPPDGYTLEPVQGATVANGQGLALVVGLQPMSAGRFEIPGFTILYHSGFHKYAAHYRQAVVVCASEAGQTGHCK